MQRRTLLGAALTVVAVGALAAVAVPLVAHSDLATTEIHTAPATPTQPPLAPLPATIKSLWSQPTATEPAAGPVVDGATAVVARSNALVGLDPATGRERWSYRRGNARLCAWAVRDGTAIAAFAKSHGCRDLVGLWAGTGARRWYRTLDFTRAEWLQPAPDADTISMVTAAGVAIASTDADQIAFDPATGLNRWTYHKNGCRLGRPVVGQYAAVTVADCNGQPTLVAHEAYAEKDRWLSPITGIEPRVVSGEDPIAVLTGRGERTTLTFYNAKGKPSRKTIIDSRLDGPLSADQAAAAGQNSVLTGNVLVLWTGSSITAVDSTRRTVLWSVPATGPPTLDGERLIFATATGVVARAVLGEATDQVSTVTGGSLPARSNLSRIAGLVVAAGGGTVSSFG